MAGIPQGEPPEEPAATMVLGPASAEAAGRRRVLAVVACIGVCAALGGYFVGRSGGEDLDAARASGTIAGKRESTKAAERDGYKVGHKAGYKQTYRKAYETAYETARETGQ